MALIKKSKILLLIFLMISVIFDSRTAFVGATAGIELCIKTVIPSLFPLFFLSGMLQNNMKYVNLNGLNKLLGVPKGAELLWIIGIMGGYPLGAKTVYDSYRNGGLTKRDAERMLGFCNNAGPAFLFGVGGLLFQNIWLVLILWLIQLFSSVLTAVVLPDKNCEVLLDTEQRNHTTVNIILKNATLAMATVCGWVILFRVFITILEKWLIGIMPLQWEIILTGFIELTNGFDRLFLLEDNAVKFVLANLFLTGGGLCVVLQTVGVIGQLDWRTFLKGKIIQCSISFPMGLISAGLLLSQNLHYIIAGCSLMALPIFGYLFIKNRKKYWKNRKSSCTI